MIITIHQPEHLPWLGFFNKLSKAELFVILDSVQFEKNYFQNRNKIIGTNGPQYINIPVNMKDHMNGTIATTEVAYKAQPKWKEKYLQTLTMSYKKYEFFTEVFPIIEEAFSQDSVLLIDYNFAIIKGFADKLGFNPKFVRSSELGVDGLKSNLILDICKATDATTYIAGPSGRDYLHKEDFDKEGIEVVFNDYNHPVYPQKKTEEFEPYMSTLDLLMNVGFEEGRKIILEGNEGFSKDWSKSGH